MDQFLSTPKRRPNHLGAAAFLPALILLLLAPALAQAQDEPPIPDAVKAVTGETGGDESTVPQEPAAEEPADSEKSEAAAASKEALKTEIDGFLKSELFFRSTDSEEDLDWITDFAVDVSRDGKMPWTVRANGRFRWDMVGNQQDDPTALLRDTWDNYGDRAQLKMYELYGKLDKIGNAPNSLWVGRMFVDDGIWLWFDGGRFDWDFDKVVQGLNISIFGGVPVRWAEESRSGNWLLGGILRWRISPEWRFRLEYYHNSEQFDGINEGLPGDVAPIVWPAQRLDDDFLGVSLWFNPSALNRLFGRFTMLNGDANELDLRWRWRSRDTRWAVLVNYYMLFSRLTNVSNELTPYVPMMGLYEPFARITARGTYQLGERWIFQLGLSHRSLLDEADEGRYNREYNHGYLSLSVLGLVDNHVDIQVFANGYSSNGSEVAAATGNVDWQIQQNWRLSAGLDFQLFKYDFVDDNERLNVWVYYAKVRWDIKRNIDANFDIAFEDSDLADIFNLRVYLRWRF